MQEAPNRPHLKLMRGEDDRLLIRLLHARLPKREPGSLAMRETPARNTPSFRSGLRIGEKNL